LFFSQARDRYAIILGRRVKTLVPNLHTLLHSTLPHNTSVSGTKIMHLGDTLRPELVAARLITNAGSLPRLATMPTSRVLSLGASKSLFRKSGAVAANSTGLFGQITRDNTSLDTGQIADKVGNAADATASVSTNKSLVAAQLKSISANRIQPDTIRRKAARLLAAKSSLACIFYPKLFTNYIKLQAQRDRRKKYRKTKHKAWLLRKLSRSAGVHTIGTSGTHIRITEKMETVQPLSKLVDRPLTDNSSSSDSDNDLLSAQLNQPTTTSPMDEDECVTDEQPRKRRKVDRNSKTPPVGRCVPRSSTGSARRSLRVKPKPSIGVTG
uniref:Nop domain-containing protein n=1 Tax=Echinostoma caproni TaxID=27848 RepID=A0A183ALJ8_9TREM